MFGYTWLYRSVPGGQAEYLRVPQAHFGPIKVPGGYPDDRFLFMSDILPTAWQAVRFADVPKGGSVAVFGLGPVGQPCARIARQLGAEQVFGIDLVPERLALAQRHGIETVGTSDIDDVPGLLRDRTQGRGPDSTIDAVGMEAHGSPVAAGLQKAAGMLPDDAAASVSQTVGVDRMSAMFDAISAVRRGGTVSLIGVYGGSIDPMPLMEMFDKGLTFRMGQAHAKRWIDDIMPLLLSEDDPLGTEDLASHHVPLEQAPQAYEMFQKKQDEAIKVVLNP